ncbi:Gfo/Idh/MocA family oxidoreductase [Candidatus Thioglobus sp.]|nr:Gfo/Idh/MocA family oxidoreductase [Candidatus Thioglobus sp.]
MKALFIGLGSIGQRHLRNLISLTTDVELMAVRSSRTVPVLSNTNQVISNISLHEYYEITEFESLDTALLLKPEMVFVTNPTSMHVEFTRKALISGAFVFIEKPISHNSDGIKELMELEDSFGKNKICVGYQFRFNPALKMLQELIKEKVIGNIVGAQLMNGEYMPGWHPYEDYRVSYAARQELGGGALVTQIHDFDYAIWLFGKPSRVFAVGGKLSDLEIDVEDSVQVLMQCKNIPVSIQLDYLQWPPRRDIFITGDKGSIHCNLSSMELIVNQREEGTTKKHKFPKFNRNDLFLNEMKNFLAFVNGKEDPMVSLKEGIVSLDIALAAKESMSKNLSSKSDEG